VLRLEKMSIKDIGADKRAAYTSRQKKIVLKSDPNMESALHLKRYLFRGSVANKR
jgi:hypothetical protein